MGSRTWFVSILSDVSVYIAVPALAYTFVVGY